MLDQSVARGGKLEERGAIATAVGMHRLGGALERLLDFGHREMAAERQAEQLPVALLLRQRLRRQAAPAEPRRRQHVQRIADDAETAQRHRPRAAIGRFQRRLAQDRQHLCGRMPQRLVDIG
ncbi:hypothetical protein chiPu_0032958, partial [Chiloscyllium punctatum]|nr:hypothetical protein [Chiloscyllium punctatum]